MRSHSFPAYPYKSILVSAAFVAALNCVPGPMRDVTKPIMPVRTAWALVTLDGTASVDPDGSIVSYAWTENGVPLGSGVRPSVNLATGIHTILLTVTDDQGGTSQDLVTITILTPLNVTVGVSPTNGASAPLTVQFTGSASGAGPIGTYDTTDDHQGTITAQGDNPPNEIAVNAFDTNPANAFERSKRTTYLRQ
jgi:hypothetical protein